MLQRLQFIVHIVLGGFCATVLPGCIEQTPVQICPVRYETVEIGPQAYSGPWNLDLLLVVDNSSSMAEKQDTVAQAVGSLIGALTMPGPHTWAYFSAPRSIRVAVTSSDLGLSFGEAHTESEINADLGCVNPKGDNGAFFAVSGDGERCLDTDETFAAGEWDIGGEKLPDQTRCMASREVGGCEVEQPLESALLALTHHPDFVHEDSILAVVFISDEDDVSIADPKLFKSAEWQNSPNTAGSYPEENTAYLFPIGRYVNNLRATKNGMGSALFFGAVAGVPAVDACQGNGTTLLQNGCLDHPDMQVVLNEGDGDTDSTSPAIRPACTRVSTADSDDTVFSATPGRRFVASAEQFQERGYVTSICSNDLEADMNRMAARILLAAAGSCFPSKMPWIQLPKDRQPSQCLNNDCGTPECAFIVQINRFEDDEEDCPEAFYAGLSEAERRQYLSQVTIERETNATGTYTQRQVFCPLPKLSLPLDCKQAIPLAFENYSDLPRWGYCENRTEHDFDDCRDGADNDDDGKVDCDDADCGICYFCGGTDECQYSPQCAKQLIFTRAAFEVIGVNFARTVCPKEGTSDNDNCQLPEVLSP